MPKIPRKLFPHTLTMTLPGKTLPSGTVAAGKVIRGVRGYGEARVRRVRNEAGDEIVVGLTIWCDPEHDVLPVGTVIECSIPRKRAAPIVLRGQVEVVIPRVAEGSGPSHLEYACSGG
jgi:hypothetical protein